MLYHVYFRRVKTEEDLWPMHGIACLCSLQRLLRISAYQNNLIQHYMQLLKEFVISIMGNFLIMEKKMTGRRNT